MNASGSFNSATGTLNTGVNAKYYDNIVTGVTNTQGLTGSDYNNMINYNNSIINYNNNMIS